MRVLLIGEYSNVHWTLAKGLKTEGVDVTVASEGDFWKNYPRDLDLSSRTFSDRIYTSVNYRIFGNRLLSENSQKLLRHLKKNRYDVIQFINPRFINDSPGNLLKVFASIRQSSARLFLGAFGDDYFFVRAGLDKKLRYSIFEPYLRDPGLEPLYTFSLDCLRPDIEKLSRTMADDVEGIVTPVVEYQIPYNELYSAKVRLIPFAVDTDALVFKPNEYKNATVSFFHGIQKGREVIKGTQYILDTMTTMKAAFGDKLLFETASNIPFKEYQTHLLKFNVVIDQIYGFSQGMNALQAMALGRVVMAGCEPEYLESMQLKSAPVFNITSDVGNNARQVTEIMREPARLSAMGVESREFIEKHHDYRKIAKKYLEYWSG